MQDERFLEDLLQQVRAKSNSREAIDYLSAQLSPAQAATFRQVLGNEQAAKELLSTPQAQALLKKIQGE